MFTARPSAVRVPARRRLLTLFQVSLKSVTLSGTVAFFLALAVDVHRAMSLADLQITDVQTSRLAYPQSCLQQQLDKRVVARASERRLCPAPRNEAPGLALVYDIVYG
jgi:hypothetical protein